LPTYQSNPPTDEERARFASAHRFYTALKRLPRFDVRLGRLHYRGDDRDGKPIFIQKRIDCMVGVDMALLAGKQKITNVALFSGDSDLIPAIEAVKREGVLTTLWHGGMSINCRPSRELFDICEDIEERFREGQHAAANQAADLGREALKIGSEAGSQALDRISEQAEDARLAGWHPQFDPERRTRQRRSVDRRYFL
jgi:hypothetical protein